MIYVYPAIVYKEENGYWAEITDLEGCLTQGDDLNELMKNLQEALEGYITSLLESKSYIPHASDINDIPINTGDFKTLVTIDFNPNKISKSVKKTLTIPYWLNEQAIEKNINFSKVLQDGLLKIIN